MRSPFSSPARFRAGTRPVTVVEARAANERNLVATSCAIHLLPTLPDSTRAEFKAGKLSKVTFKYGFPQYAKPAAAASKQLGFKVGKEHETVVLTRGKDGKDEYKVRSRSSTPDSSTPARSAERTRTHDRSRPRAGHRQHGVPQAGCAERDEVRVGQGEAVPGGAKVYEVTRRHSWRRRRRAPERRV